MAHCIIAEVLNFNSILGLYEPKPQLDYEARCSGRLRINLDILGFCAPKPNCTSVFVCRPHQNVAAAVRIEPMTSCNAIAAKLLRQAQEC